MSCTKCGECCKRMGLPPFITASIGGTERPKGAAAASYAAAAEYVRADKKHDIERDFGGCWWYDHKKKRCRFYGQRPDICREYDCTTGEKALEATP